jgi:hypothetical protein
MAKVLESPQPGLFLCQEGLSALTLSIGSNGRSDVRRNLHLERRNTMSEDNGTLMRRWFEEVWNKGNAEAIDELFDADGIVHGLSSDA